MSTQRTQAPNGINRSKTEQPDLDPLENKIKHYRAVATRYDKRPENFLAGVKLA